MFILPQEYHNEYIKGMETYLHDLLYSFQSEGRRIDWLRLIETVCYNAENLARQSIVSYLEKLDRDFKESEARKRQYYVKDYLQRTLITMFGEISYYRTVYTDKDTNERYIYVDRKLHIDPYIRYTDDVRAYAYEAYSDENSMIKVGKELGNLIHSKFALNRNDDHSISRQTIYNFLNIKPAHYVSKTKRKRKRIFLLLDEKFIGCQDKDSKIMSKVCMIYEEVKRKGNRNILLGKTFFSSADEYFHYDLLTYLDEIYELDCLKEMYCMGDGGKWIKEAFRQLKIPGCTQFVCLDRFHAYRALYDLCREYTPYSIALYYISREDQDSFKKAIRHFVRSDKDKDNYRYLINNFNEICNMYYALGPCAMEQCISHHVMSQFTSVAKAYSSKNIERYLHMRDNYRNGINMKKLYIEAKDDERKDKPITYINSFQLDLSIFETKADIPYYDTSNIRGKLRFLPI